MGPIPSLLAAAVLLATPRPVLDIPRVERPPLVEDFLDMRPSPEFEGRMAHVTGLTQRTPEDGQPASQKTDIYFGYDQEHIYAVFVAFDDEPQRIRARLGRRENVFDDDIVEVMFDTFHDQQRAYAFVATPLGVQWDAIWTEGRGFDDSWDTVWRSEGRRTDRGYVVRMAIPFKSLRFSAAEEQTWGLFFVRDIPRNNESSFWPRNTNRIEGRLNQAATLTGLRDISPGRNIQLIPYVFSRRFRTLDPTGGTFERDSLDPDVGLDAKFVLRDSLALDLTANPDFSQVESDQPQVTVNQRFEVFFPEKRPFFLENKGFFDTPFNLLFTRRIADPSAGARLTGQLDHYNIGALLIDDEAPAERARFGVLRLSRDLPRQSRLGLIYTDRELDGDTNRVGGLDGRIKLGENWDTRFQFVQTWTREAGEQLQGPAATLDFNRSGRKFGAHIHYQEVDREFRTRAGFIPRVDIRDLHQQVSYRFRPEGRRLVSWAPTFFTQHVADHDGTRLDWAVNPSFNWEFRRQTDFNVFGRFGRERLRPSDLEAFVSSPTEALDFGTRSVGASFSTRFVQSVSGSANLSFGRGINLVPPDNTLPTPAELFDAGAELTLRPGRRLRIDNTYLLRRLDDRDSGRRILTNQIARTRFNLQFDTRLSLRLILQYESTRVAPDLTRLDAGKRYNGDVLVTYLVNPWTAFHVGYNTDYRDLNAPDDFLNDARQIFFKLSYLFRP